MEVNTERQLQMRDALLPLVGRAGYQALLTVMYGKDVLQAAGLSYETIARVEAVALVHGVEALPCAEVVLESDSKSRIYVVQTQLGEDAFRLVVKWYRGKRQPFAYIEQHMNAYFYQHLMTICAVGPILALVPFPGAASLSVAILPYLGEVTLYDHLHAMPRHTPQTEALLRQASRTLAHAQVLGRLGHEQQAIQLTPLTPQAGANYFLQQIDSALLQPYAASGQPLPMATTLLNQFAFFADLLAADSSTAGLYYRGINPRNIMWRDGQQIEIDFEQDTLRSRFIDIVTLLENGLEIANWDESIDYPAFSGQMSFARWQIQHRRAWETLAQHNYLTHQQIETLTGEFLDTTYGLEQQYLTPARPPLSQAERDFLMEVVRVFRHLQYVGYCKRNEQQAFTTSKRTSSRYRQQFHALWAKCALDRLLYPHRPTSAGLSAAGKTAAATLRRTLDHLPLGRDEGAG